MALNVGICNVQQLHELCQASALDMLLVTFNRVVASINEEPYLVI